MKRKTVDGYCDVDNEQIDDEIDVAEIVDRLTRRYGNAVLKKDGTSPDNYRNIPDLICRTFSVLKYGVEAHRATKQSVVTLGLNKFVKNRSINSLLTKDEIIDTLKSASNYTSRVVKIASMFANWIFITKLHTVDALPDATSKFFKACLAQCRGSNTNKSSGVLNFEAEFTIFSQETNINAVTNTVGNLDQIFVYQAQEMSTAANNFIGTQYTNRLYCIIRWALKKQLQGRVTGMTRDVLARRIQLMIDFVSELNGSDDDLIEQIHNKLIELGLGDHVLDVEYICGKALEAPKSSDSNSTKLKYILLLQQEFLHADRRQYIEIQQQSWNLFPDKTDTMKQSRGSYMQAHWKFDTPPKEMAPLPMSKSSAKFIRVCKKGFTALFPEVKDHCRGPWWYLSFANPFSKQCNIPLLRSTKNRFATSESSMFKALDIIKNDKAVDLVCPTLVNNSFMTNGIELKLSLVTSKHEHEYHPGLAEINKAGYQVSFKKQTLSSVLQRGSGVYKLRHIKGTLHELDEVEVTSIDPGQVHVIDGITSLGKTWKREKVVQLMNAQRVTYTGDDYDKKIFRKMSEEKETQRRQDTVYGDALEELASQQRKTCILAEFKEYCKTWAQVHEQIWNEALTLFEK